MPAGTRVPMGDQSGVVFVEFLIAIVPLWVFFLCMLQLAFITQANLMVKHAADSAARSAVVVLPDDPHEYGGEPEMSVARGRVTAAGLARALSRIASILSGRSDARALATAVSETTLANIGRSRLNTIRLAAHIPLMSLAPVNVGRDGAPSISKAIGTKRKLLSATYYQPFALAVTFPGLRGELAQGPEITVRVSYAFQCTVPLARQILCTAFEQLAHRDELDQAFLPLAQRLVGGRFRSLQHETTLMLHDAPYEYRERGS